MLTEVRLLPRKAPNPILVTESGMVTEVRLLLIKALLPILVTELGIVTELKIVAQKNIPCNTLIHQRIRDNC